MFSKRTIIALALTFTLSSAFIDSCAQWTPDRLEVNLGSFGLDSSVAQGGNNAYQIGVMPVIGPSNTSLLMNNSSSMNNSSIEGTSMVNRRPPILDLSNYARDRLNGNLSGYTNIMYPFGESRGAIPTTAEGGGGGGGCGCSG
jgi:hypothetical protein